MKLPSTCILNQVTPLLSSSEILKNKAGLVFEA
ncbi:hypothetical protein TorRG33x02_051290 [Trema orientale]|uniref:Uncharacterized protein n=1 Tax=Trema orientale TaxID=63057 RepID=A0A2P5FM64_TREOI|nr:hypothetical protein TorRG33x02_051290 [Trema orientale]